MAKKVEQQPSTEQLRQIADAKWSAMNHICNMCISLCEAATSVTYGFFGDALGWHLQAQMCGVELLRLYPLLLHDANEETLVELGLIPTHRVGSGLVK